MKRKIQKVTIVVAVVLITLAWPKNANADVSEMLTLLKTITSTLRSDIGLVLGTIRATKSAVANLEQVVVWPTQTINQAKGLAANLRAQYTGGAQSILLLSLNSATLQNQVQFESIIRGGQIGGFSQISASYSQVFQPLPAAGNARSNDRNVMDADDATALAALKASIAADQSNGSTLSVADVLERQAASTAPGAAPLLLAQAQATELQNQALLHHLLAAELRVEAAKMAHQNAIRKRHVEANTNLRLQLHQVLTR